MKPTTTNVLSMPNGIYQVRWKRWAGGGQSIGSVYTDKHGDRFFAATNHDSPVILTMWKTCIRRITLILSD